MLELRRFAAVVRKETLHIMRDRNTLRMILMMPVVQVIVYGYAVDTDIKHLKTAVFDEDRTPLSRRLTAAFVASQSFDATLRVDNPAAMRRALDRGVVKAALRIPPGFARDVAAGRGGRLQFAIDGTDSTPATAALGNGGAVVNAFMRGEGLAPPPAIDLRSRLWYNPELKSALFFIPGLIGFLLGLLIPLALIATVVREKESGTIEQLIVTPLRRWEIIFGKLTPYVVIGMGVALSILAAGRVLFDVRVRGSLPLLLALTLLYLVVCLGIGLFASAVSETQQQATSILSITIAPSILLSGYIFPRESMPPAIRFVSDFIPLTYYLRIVRGIALKALGFADLWRETLALALMAVAIMTLSVLKFRKRLA
jgi:ABC-2 type transport system permease protein